MSRSWFRSFKVALAAASCLLALQTLSQGAEAGFLGRRLIDGHLKRGFAPASSTAPLAENRAVKGNRADALTNTAGQASGKQLPGSLQSAAEVSDDGAIESRALPGKEAQGEKDVAAHHSLGAHGAEGARGEKNAALSPRGDGSGEQTSPGKIDAREPLQTPAARAVQVQPGPPEYHRTQMRLSGSMCYACLHDLHEKLKKTNGIERLKIDRPEQGFYQPYAPDVSSWAQAIIVYDAVRLPLDELKSVIHNNGYHAYKIVDKLLEKPLDQLTDEKL